MFLLSLQLCNHEKYLRIPNSTLTFFFSFGRLKLSNSFVGADEVCDGSVDSDEVVADVEGVESVNC